jgi:hypothetical protein
VQTPFEQVSVFVASHVEHPAPPVPHDVVVGVVQTFPLQHPAGQLFVSQTHWPPTHSCPAPHGAPPPHAQAPTVQRSAFVGSHAPHAPPPLPHCEALVDVTHVFPTQHPAHVVAHPAQLPLMQASPGLHVWHALPFAPHADVLGDTHAPLASQQPFGHDVASHTHLPPRHSCPAAHGRPLPQVQMPPVHESDFVASQAEQAAPAAAHAFAAHGVQTLPLQQPFVHDVASHTHAPPTQACPGAHARPAPHAQTPAAHESERSGSHAMHVLPFVPHVDELVAMHVAPLQQPLAHDVASHTHAPPTQCWPATHGALVPQAHAPFAQESASIGSHVAHAPPLAPHALVDGTLHTPAWQHPFGHVVALHGGVASASALGSESAVVVASSVASPAPSSPAASASVAPSPKDVSSPSSAASFELASAESSPTMESTEPSSTTELSSPDTLCPLSSCVEVGSVVDAPPQDARTHANGNIHGVTMRIRAIFSPPSSARHTHRRPERAGRRHRHHGGACDALQTRSCSSRPDSGCPRVLPSRSEVPPRAEQPRRDVVADVASNEAGETLRFLDRGCALRRARAEVSCTSR